MNTQWLNHLRDGLARLEANDRLRTLRITDPTRYECNRTGKFVSRDGKTLINFAGNDYLALAQDEQLKSAAINAIEQFGTGSGASRLVTGHQSLHTQLETRFAQFKHAEAALLFCTGYMANLAVLTTLPQSNDIILMDKLCHASLIDAARASEAVLRVFPHRDYKGLQKRLHRIRRANTPSHMNLFIVTDSIFSMDGDAADLPQLCELAREFNAITVVDEAHATGLFGEQGTGLCEAQGVTEHVDVVISTASKALGGLGGIVTAARPVVDTLINRARSLIYTTAPPAAQVAAIMAAIDVIENEPHRRQHVRQLAQSLRDQLTPLATPGVLEIPHGHLATPIVPLITGTAASALVLSESLQSVGIYAPAIRPPTVAPNRARVRLTLRADMNEQDLQSLVDAVRRYLS